VAVPVDEDLYRTDPTWRPDPLVSLFTGRRSSAVTFQAGRTPLGFTTPRHWSATSVPRSAPCLLGRFRRVSLIFARPVRDQGLAPWGSIVATRSLNALTVTVNVALVPTFPHVSADAGKHLLDKPASAGILMDEQIDVSPRGRPSPG
jgi:hypothetical protein